MRKRLLPLLLAAALLLTSCGGSIKSTTMYLKRTEGRVGVSDNSGKDVEPRDDLGLYSGYEVKTKRSSYAWIDLDEVKLTKLDEHSEIEITKEGKALEIEVKAGSLFFNVTEPLADDETMTIRSSSMMVDIRGTCGWVSLSEDEDTLSIYLLEGKVECSNKKETATIYAGEMAEITKRSKIEAIPFTAQDVPDFVVEEIEDDDDLLDDILDDSGIDILNPYNPLADALAAYRPSVEQASAYFQDDIDYGADSTIIYKYALVQMQMEYPIPALLLEQETYNTYWGDLSHAVVIQYDPNSQTVIQAKGELNAGVASAGGFRGGFSAAGDGNGILAWELSSGTGHSSTSRVTLEGDSLVWVTLWEGNFFEDEDWTETEIGNVEIDWHDVSDLSGLNPE